MENRDSLSRSQPNSKSGLCQKLPTWQGPLFFVCRYTYTYLAYGPATAKAFVSKELL